MNAETQSELCQDIARKLGGTEKSKPRSSEGISGRDAHVHDVRSVTSDARMLTTSTPFDSSESAVR